MFGLLGLSALALSLYTLGLILAEPTAAAAPGASTGLARTRVAVLNLHETLKNYQKFKIFREQMKSKAEGYEAMLKKKQERFEALQTEFKQAQTSPEKKEKIEQEAKAIRFEMDDIKQKAQKELFKLNTDQLSTIYLEVDAVVREYCKTNGIDLVIRYSEDWDKDNYNKPENIVRRLDAFAFWPMYYDANMEITAAVVDVLNRKYAGGGTSGAIQPAGGVRPN